MQVESTYLCAYFNSTEVKRLIIGQKRGQIQEHLNVKSLRAVPVPVPPIEIQRQFVQRLAEIAKVKQAYRASLVEMDALFASLQDRAFRGEL